jgi:hypothetical protein
MQIEQGKYYVTRDGRRVGPMYRAVRGGWVNGAPIGSWDDDGFSTLGGSGLALVAEWTDPPKACAAAEVDNLRDEYGPFGADSEDEVALLVGTAYAQGFAAGRQSAIGGAG